MLRTAFWENTAQGGIPWHQMRKDHEKNSKATLHITREAKQAEWHTNRIASTIHQHKSNMAAQALTPDNIRDDLTRNSQHAMTTTAGKQTHNATSTNTYETNRPTAPSKAS